MFRLAINNDCVLITVSVIIENVKAFPSGIGDQGQEGPIDGFGVGLESVSGAVES